MQQGALNIKISIRNWFRSQYGTQKNKRVFPEGFR
jgi:hypothetical protein